MLPFLFFFSLVLCVVVVLQAIELGKFHIQYAHAEYDLNEAAVHALASYMINAVTDGHEDLVTEQDRADYIRDAREWLHDFTLIQEKETAK